MSEITAACLRKIITQKYTQMIKDQAFKVSWLYPEYKENKSQQRISMAIGLSLIELL